MRLHQETPVRISLKEHLRNEKRPTGRPKTTWISVITKDLNGLIDFKNPQASIERLEDLCSNREGWRSVVKGLMLLDMA